MPFLLPFRRASAPEKVVQIIAYPVALLLGVGVMAPLGVMTINSFGDITDAKAGITLPVSLKRYAGPDPFYIRYLHQRYEGLPELALNHWYPEHIAGPAGQESMIDLPSLVQRVGMPPGNWRRQAEDARACMRKGMPWNFKELLFLSWTWNPSGGNEIAIACSGKLADDWHAYLIRKYLDVAGINREFGTAYRTVRDIAIPTTLSLENANAYMLGTPLLRAWKDYLGDNVDPDLVTLLSSDLDFSGYLNGIPATGGDLGKANAIFKTSWASWHDTVLPETEPADPGQRVIWDGYMKEEVNPYILEIIDPARLGPAWAAFLAKAHGSVEAAAAAWGLPMAPTVPPARLEAADSTEAGFRDWSNFARSLPGSALRARTHERVWRTFLRDKYATPEALASAWGIPVAGFDTVVWPQPSLDRAYYDEHTVATVTEGLFHNYRRAWIMIASATPALWNTLRYTGLALLLCLGLNTGIAYCLSRFKFPPLQLSLAYFLAISAFPIEAMAIPNFILLRQIGLLNTVWALALPTAVNGYFIYLLKSAFDAIPPSWFEMAQIEGAGEWPLFLEVALPSARPMIAVVALYGFMFAWSNFLWAMIVGQSREMWTMPVLIFTMHNWTTAPSLVSAALVLMTLPPLIVFVAANRTVQRGLTAKPY